MEEKEENITIRQAELSDINDIMKINRACLPENYSFDFFYRIISNFGFTCIVGEVNNKIGGYVLCRVEKPLSSVVGLAPLKGHVISIAVLPRYRRQKLGTKMMKNAMRRLVDYGVEKIYLEVRISNRSAIEMYRKLKYEIKKELTNYYRDGESAFLMEWQ